MPDTTKEPQPFLPAWRIEIGPHKEDGRGLMPARLFSQRALVDRFTVLLGTFCLTVCPKSGEIKADGQTVLKTEPGSLLWFRRMEQQIGSLDPNSAAAKCLFYGVGIQKADKRVGFRVYSDNTARQAEV